ncbi:MAG: hypothetical protein KIT80_09510 [Chitinophagaceae bacterium]|nr:hypothetical protein [Chitinophagaceae bacterium]MCW5927136.1 hypothetical protein [Chitinophagaceae bacterium]
MYKQLFLAYLCLISVLNSHVLCAQVAIEPYIGYSIDLNNKDKLSLFNAGLQVPVINKPFYQMLVMAEGGFPLDSGTGESTAYTPNPLLPLTAKVESRTKLNARTFGLLHRWKPVEWGSGNSLSVFIKLAFTNQHIKVVYKEFNEVNYTIFNPRSTLNYSGLIGGGGIQFNRVLGAGTFFAQLNAAYPLLEPREKNYHFKLIVPLSINTGYAINLTKKKTNEKQ